MTRAGSRPRACATRAEGRIAGTRHHGGIDIIECLEIHISMTEFRSGARVAPSEARGSPLNVDQSPARNGCVVVELEVPKVAGSGILKNKDCVLIFRGYA